MGEQPQTLCLLLTWQSPTRTLRTAITYILQQVQQSGCNGFEEDDEIYSMAVHYYDEDDLEVGSRVACNVVVNHTIVLTEEEKAEARKQAIQQYQAEELRKLQEPKRVKAKASTNSDPIPLPTIRNENEAYRFIAHCPLYPKTKAVAGTAR